MFKIAWIIIDEDNDMKLVHYEPSDHVYYSSKVIKVVYSEIEDD